MALTITHTTVATAADDPDAEINKDEWNEAHTLAGDYLRKATVTLSSADILALHTTPVTLVAAPGAGKWLLPHRITGVLTYGSAAYSVADGISPKWDGVSAYFGDLTGLFQATEDKFQTTIGNSASFNGPFPGNVALVLTDDAGDPTTGDGTAVITVWYSVEDIP